MAAQRAGEATMLEEDKKGEKKLLLFYCARFTNIYQTAPPFAPPNTKHKVVEEGERGEEKYRDLGRDINM
jgi:hypothetical protein